MYDYKKNIVHSSRFSSSSLSFLLACDVDFCLIISRNSLIALSETCLLLILKLNTEKERVFILRAEHTAAEILSYNKSVFYVEIFTIAKQSSFLNFFFSFFSLFSLFSLCSIQYQIKDIKKATSNYSLVVYGIRQCIHNMRELNYNRKIEITLQISCM